MAKHLPLLIIGAGPFGLVMSAHARRRGIEHIVIGKPMEFWNANMPKDMVLRSACDWHYDSSAEDTIERYLQTKNLKPNDVEFRERAGTISGVVSGGPVRSYL